jgi:hypothetical protein
MRTGLLSQARAFRLHSGQYAERSRVRTCISLPLRRGLAFRPTCHRYSLRHWREAYHGYAAVIKSPWISSLFPHRGGFLLSRLSIRLGHANSAITLSIYSHALPADVNAAAEVWNAAMANVIQTARKSALPARMLANVSGKNAKKTHVDEIKGLGMVGAAGLEPATLSFEG